MALSRITEAVASFTDLTIGDDLTLTDDFLMASDASIIKFGADAEVTLTHVHNTGLLLNSTSVIQFNDASQNIGAPSATVLDINATDEIELNATLIDINGNVEISGTLAQADAITMATNTKIIFRDAAIHISSTADGDLSIAADDEIDLTSTLIDINGNVEVSGTTAQVGVSTSTAKDIFNAGMSTKNGATSAGFVEFFEDSDNGTNKVTVIGPASTADVTLTLPNSAGTIATTATAADEATALAIALG
jgi:ribosomal protein S9